MLPPLSDKAMLFAIIICVQVLSVFGESPRVTVKHGTLVGSKTKTYSGYEYYEFLQIPYAKAPIGEFRFKVSPKNFVFNIYNFSKGHRYEAFINRKYAVITNILTRSHPQRSQLIIKDELIISSSSSLSRNVLHT